MVLRRSAMFGLFAGAFLLVTYLLLQARPFNSVPGVIEPGQAAPDFVLETAAGERLQLADLRGRPVVLNFWATWCPPCRAEMPDLEALYAKGREQGLVVVGINLQESGVSVKAFQERHGLTFPLALDTEGAVTKAYGVIPLPTTYFVDRQGRVTARLQGQAPPPVLGREVERLLKGR